MTTPDESMRRHPSAPRQPFAGELQTLTPTFSLYTAHFPLDYARRAEDWFAFVEHLGADYRQLTVRMRTERHPSVQPWPTSHYVHLLTEAAAALTEGAK